MEPRRHGGRILADAPRPGKGDTGRGRDRGKGGPDMRFSKAIEEFLTEAKVGRSPLTIECYKSDLHRLKILTKHDTILEFDNHLVRRYFIHGSEAGLKMATLHRRMATVREFAKYLLAKKRITENPCDGLQNIRRPEPVPRPFSRAQLERILALELSVQERVVRGLLVLTGLRVTPLCGLRVEDLSFDPPLIRALVKGAKTQSIQMHPALVDLLQSYVLSHTDLDPKSCLFLAPAQKRKGKMLPAAPYRRKQISKMTKRWGHIAGVQDCTPHRFRHSFATNLLDAGVDIRIIKEAMGHADIKSTMVYTQVTDRHLRDAIAKLPWSDSTSGLKPEPSPSRPAGAGSGEAP